MTKNNDGLEAGATVSWADMVAANAARSDFVADGDTITRENIADMKRKDVIEHLEAHGMNKADCKGVELPDLRDMLVSAMFVDA